MRTPPAPRAVMRSTVIDHIQAVASQDDSLFWVESNWRPLCASCHGRKTGREDGGFGRLPRTRRVSFEPPRFEIR